LQIARGGSPLPVVLFYCLLLNFIAGCSILLPVNQFYCRLFNFIERLAILLPDWEKSWCKLGN
jgi:hypothetical protein